jgi:glutamate synthase domain-containing protein 3
MININALNMDSRELNMQIKESIANGHKEINIINALGQRFIGNGIQNKDLKITINGTVGNDLGMFMDGVDIELFGNAQDGVGNTLNSGTICVHGRAGDVVGYAARGGKIFIEKDVGYRVGIHMKEFKTNVPTVVVGGSAGSFLGEYMAGGILVILNLDSPKTMKADAIGTGMHGGKIYIRGEVNTNNIGKEVVILDIDDDDYKILKNILSEYGKKFNFNSVDLLKDKFIKLKAISHRPYGNLYAY